MLLTHLSQAGAEVEEGYLQLASEFDGQIVLLRNSDESNGALENLGTAIVADCKRGQLMECTTRLGSARAACICGVELIQVRR